MDQTERQTLDRIARGELVDAAGVSEELRPLVQAAQLLALEGRAVEPPAGSFKRISARVARPEPRPSRIPSLLPSFGLLRPVLASVLVVVLLVGSLGGAAYASTPGEPLFQLQRALDEAYVALPRSAQDAATVSMSVADRRVSQAASAAKVASPDLLRLVLNDSLRYLERARASVAHLSDGQRQLVASRLVALERKARERLQEAKNEADDENDNVLNEVDADLERNIDRDLNDAQSGPGQQQDSSAGSPAPQGMDQDQPGMGQDPRQDGPTGTDTAESPRP